MFRYHFAVAFHLFILPEKNKDRLVSSEETAVYKIIFIFQISFFWNICFSRGDLFNINPDEHYPRKVNDTAH